jgi:hypothetical protein
MRYVALGERKLRKFLFHCLKSVVGPHGRDQHLHGPVEGVLIKTCCFMGRAADDHRVSGGATAATAGVSTTLGKRGMPVKEGRRWATKKGRVIGHCMRRAVRVRVATGGGDVMRRRLREERSEGSKGISGMRVWWRWWEQVHGLLVTRGFAVCIVTALRDWGVGNNGCNGKCSVGRLRVHTSVNERHLLED